VVNLPIFEGFADAHVLPRAVFVSFFQHMASLDSHNFEFLLPTGTVLKEGLLPLPNASTLRKMLASSD
jgi:hypothetical protein